MRLPIKPWVFFGRLIAFFFLTYFLWKLVAPLYTPLLLHATQAAVRLSERSSDPLWHAGTTIVARGTALFYSHRAFAAFVPPIPPQGIPAEWVMANVVLLVPLMLAMPAATWRLRCGRLAAALALALVLQVLDIMVTIKSFYAATFAGHWSPTASRIYQLLNVFFQSFDTQLFPVVIWAGIHFRDLLGRGTPPPAQRPRPEAGKPGARSRPPRRRGPST